MRITGGKARGIVLKSSSWEGLRPSGDALREALFSSLGDLIVGARVVDLFAGTGAYGLEALSRGAACVTFVENHRKVAKLLADNIQALCKSAERSPDDCTLLIKDATKPVDGLNADLVFLDPPYLLMRKYPEKILEAGVGYWAVSDRARLIVESPADLELPVLAGCSVVKAVGKEGKNKPRVTLFKPSVF